MENLARVNNGEERIVKVYGKNELEGYSKEFVKDLLNNIAKEYVEAESVKLFNFNGNLLVKSTQNDIVDIKTYKNNKFSKVNELNEDIQEIDVTFNDNFGKHVNQLPDFIIDKDMLEMIQDCMYNEINVLFAGGPGTGKTDFPQQLAKKLDMNYLVVDCGTIKTPQDWFGTREFVEGEGTKFIESELVKYLQNPSIIILDELNRTTPDCHNSIFRILDGNREVHITALKKTIKVHPHCIILGTINEGRSHTGTFKMDSAIEDRFEKFRFHIPNEKQIIDLLSSKFNKVKMENIEYIARLTIKLAELYESEELTKQLGLRSAINSCKLLQINNNNLIKVLNQTFVNRFNTEDERIVVKQAMSAIIPSEKFK